MPGRIHSHPMAAMPSLSDLWLPVAAATAAVFVASSLLHMVVPIHKGDYRKLPDEDATLAALRQRGVGPGQYMFPCPASMQEMASPALQERYRLGPVGTLIVRRNGVPAIGVALLQWAAFCLVSNALVAIVAGFSCAPGSADVFQVATTVALLPYAFSSVSDSIWKGVAWTTTAKFVFDGIVYAHAAGAMFAWLWPAA